MSTQDRVQANTARQVNHSIATAANLRILTAAGATDADISAHLEKLDREWDIERWLEANGSTVALTGLLLGLVASRRFFVIPIMVLSFLLLHAVQGWCPPLPILRRLGVRTRREIDDEKFAFKVLRGDFDGVAAKEYLHTEDGAERVLEAVRA